jgi:hypothetical protein
MLVRHISPRVLATAAVLCALSGCTKSTLDAARAEPSDADVLALSDKLSAAYRAQDLGGLRALMAPDYTGSAPGILLDFDGLIEEFPQIQMRDIQRDAFFVKHLSPGTVLLTEDVTLSETYRQEDISGKYRMTTVWVNRAGKWQLLFEQEMPTEQRSDTSGQSQKK